ncbi:major facilitator superfamily domain-containing protein [Fusarium tricinctum]|uniref:Major facilitator superfamily domain-containing protein n=1 Tax=Fusarium tricinctum TaxID=61284 RepID=A0A8K0RKV7_9HYPO|nr:major facilitator superfamily domain-containing protein [Fusarium tricinctum]
MEQPQFRESIAPLTSTPADLSSACTPVNGSSSTTPSHSAFGSEVELQMFTEADIEQRNHSQTLDGAEPPPHIFSKHKKWMLVYLVSLGGSFSALSSNIYFPAIDAISTDLGVSTADVTLTITVYMIVQGVAPSLYGAISDTHGRRLTFLLTLVVYTAANLSLAFTSNFPMLLVLRGLQAAGSSATISISTGVISDIAEPGERGGFMGTNAGIRMISQAIGPVIGGLLNSAWGFRSIFWFLFAFSVHVFIALLVFLPETQRKIAGDGSIPLAGFYKPWSYFFRPPKEWRHGPTPQMPKLENLSWKKIFEPLMYIFRMEILVLLSWGALVYTIWSMVTVSTTTVLLRTFPELTQWQIGLCFLPNGVGCVLGSICTGQLMDRAFKRAEARYKEEHGLNVNVKTKQDFPFERARLSLMPYFTVIFLVSMALYGPSYEFNDLRRHFAGNLVASLGLQFLIAFAATAIFNINSTILVDIFPDNSAGATATNNLCRCLLGAVGVSVIQPLISAIKIRNAFLVLTATALLFSPLVWVQWRMAGKWGEKRLHT